MTFLMLYHQDWGQEEPKLVDTLLMSVLKIFYVICKSNYRPQSEGDNALRSLCLSVCALPAEPFDLRSWVLAWGSTLTLARMGL